MLMQLSLLKLAVEELKKQLRLSLLRQLGVDEQVRKAFYEGWQMRGETDEHRAKELGFDGIGWIDHVVHDTRIWRHVDEAWLNSDAEELV